MPATFSFDRYRALLIKECHQIRRNWRMMVQLTIPPTLVLIVIGYALNPEVKHLPTAIVDLDGGSIAREIAQRIDGTQAFDVTHNFVSIKDAQAALERRDVDIVVVLPPNLSADVSSTRPVKLQVLVDGVIANSAVIAGAYLKQIIGHYSIELLQSRPVQAALALHIPEQIDLRAVALYNPGLVFSWYYLTGLMSVILFVDGSLLAAAVTVREKEIGTIEQLLMSPAQSAEIILAKSTPVLGLLVIGFAVGTTTAWLWFDLPLRGPFWLFLLTGVAAGLAALGVGTLIGTFSANQQQAQFLTFFVNPPMVLLSGAFARVENLPEAFQVLSTLLPLRYFVEIVRGITMKGVGIEFLWPRLLALTTIAAVVYTISAIRFRRQLN
jgi:ABC-2 type transport system permease protein